MYPLYCLGPLENSCTSLKQALVSGLSISIKYNICFDGICLSENNIQSVSSFDPFHMTNVSISLCKTYCSNLGIMVSLWFVISIKMNSCKDNCFSTHSYFLNTLVFHLLFLRESAHVFSDLAYH